MLPRFPQALPGSLLTISLLAGLPVKAPADTDNSSSTGQTEVPSLKSSSGEIEKKPRLRFRDSDGTCACTCASGGTKEADIRRAEEARRAETGKGQER